MFDEICCKVLVSEDCIVSAKHEANVPVRLTDSEFPHPPGTKPLSHANWTKE